MTQVNITPTGVLLTPSHTVDIFFSFFATIKVYLGCILLCAYLVVFVLFTLKLFQPYWPLSFILFKDKIESFIKTTKGGSGSGSEDGEDPKKKWIKYLLAVAAIILAFGVGYIIWFKWGGSSGGATDTSKGVPIGVNLEYLPKESAPANNFNPSLDKQYVHPANFDISILDDNFWWPTDLASGEPLVGNKEYIVYYIEHLKYTDHLLKTSNTGSTQSLLDAASDRHSSLIILRYGNDYITEGEFKYFVKLDNPINIKPENLEFAKDNLIFSESIRGHYINGNLIDKKTR